MSDFSAILKKPLALSPTTMGKLSRAEAELLRADALLSESSLSAALAHQMLRLEAIASVLVEGSHVNYSDLAKFESSLYNIAPFGHAPKTLFRRVKKLGCTNATEIVRTICYMDAVRWISENISCNADINLDVFENISELYNEQEISSCQQNANSRSSDTILKNDSQSMRQERRRKDYLNFLNSDKFSPSAQAEISHAYIQSIGTRRVVSDGYERAFSHIIFYRRGVLTKSIAPLAIGPAIDIERHAVSISDNMDALSEGSEPGCASCFDFLGSAFCTAAAARTMNTCLRATENLYSRWKDKLNIRNEQETIGQLARLFLEWGFLTIDFSSKKISRSFSMTSTAMQSFVDAGIAREAGHINKRRLYCAPDVLNFYSSLLEKLECGVTMTRDEALEEIQKQRATIDGDQ